MSLVLVYSVRGNSSETGVYSTFFACPFGYYKGDHVFSVVTDAEV